jgi:kinesin family member 2/24
MRGQRGKQNNKRLNTRDAIAELARKREERRRSASDFKRNRKQQQQKNEREGRPGDVDFQNMIEDYRENTKLRKRSHKPIDNSNINIAIRKRPILQREVARKDWDSITCLHPLTLVHQCSTKVDGISKFLSTTEFSFDHSFDEKDTNDSVYRNTAKPLIPFVLAGGNATVFAYGQTGSGKTYTMTAIQESAASDIFSTIEEEHGHDSLGVRVSFFEIYGGRCIDLLNRRSRLSIREDGRGNVVVGGLKELECYTASDMLDVMKLGHQARATSKTEMNETSSRSHAICRVEIFDRVNNDRSVGKFSLIDLAGSERGVDTKNHNRQRRIEGAEINKSLLALKECIRALDNRTRGHIHVPYRASKLTLVLKDSFSKQSRTVMICNISPGASATEHTLNTLRYADRVKQKEVVHAYNMESTMPNIRKKSNDDKKSMSPAGVRLKSVQRAAREGKISLEEKKKIKSEIIEQSMIEESKNSDEHFPGDLATAKNKGGRPPVFSQGGRRQSKRQQLKQQDPTSIISAAAPSRRQWANRRPLGGGKNGSPKPNTDDSEEPSGGRGRGGQRKKSLPTTATPPENTPPKRRGGRRANSERNSTISPSNEDDEENIPVPSPHNKDLEILHRSLRANRDVDGGSTFGDGGSAELLDMHVIISELVKEEEDLLEEHMVAVTTSAELLTEEGKLLARVNGENVVDYDIDVYAQRLDEILEKKIRMYTALQGNLKRFRRHLKAEEEHSKKLRN